ncbi:thiopurine S-methyltransferase [Thalassomonas sp. M1454]|uniref:thiopurine S-methyltransferase n=1 Tax=Thalassomonas sp. M1454 TaxID=2594477 RepID=UPI001180B5F8|nr:thiopurine S-methyltransferase [Thalassomonas sp. M1454]TRX56407.1 thiopurine S-methyltransferase [Thalassomonas sp. M1454]
MKQDFWHQCWENTHIGFHQDELQPLLIEYFPQFIEAEDSRVFVPCCGKSSDLLYFSKRFKVIGNELSAIACRDFFHDNHLIPNIKQTLRFNVFEQGNISLYQGDFFSLKSDSFKPFDWIYDRAALIAFPEDMRSQYVAHLKSFIQSNTRVFLLTLEFPQGEIIGPPFSVTQSEVEGLFQGYEITKVATRDLTGQKFARRSLPVSKLVESLYIIKG